LSFFLVTVTIKLLNI